MDSDKSSVSTTISVATKVDFDYVIKIDGVADIAGSGTVLVAEENPSLEKIKGAVDTYVAEKAATHLGTSYELIVDASIVVKKVSRFTTNMSIKHV